MLEGQAPAERLRFASAAAALSVQTKGAMSSMPLRADVERFLATLPLLE
jgi:ribokinase